MEVDERLYGRGGTGMDKITLTRMEFYGYHGVLPEETRLGQRYCFDVELLLPLEPAGRSDRLADTINYAEVWQKVKDIVEGKPYRLIEALAERVASELLRNYTSISEITVRVTKPHPPVPAVLAGVTVEIHRKRAS